MQVRKMRILRQKYGISLTEIARACGVSKQRVSQIELITDRSVELETAGKIIRAFAGIAQRRRTEYQNLERDFTNHKATLLDCVEEDGYEL